MARPVVDQQRQASLGALVLQAVAADTLPAVKTLLRLLVAAFAAAIAYELVQRQRASVPLPEGAPFEPAPTASPKQPESSGADDLTAINGIGPVYARKLEAAEVRTFTDLADADPQALADDLETSESVVSGWQEQARRLRT